MICVLQRFERRNDGSVKSVRFDPLKPPPGLNESKSAPISKHFLRRRGEGDDNRLIVANIGGNPRKRIRRE